MMRAASFVLLIALTQVLEIAVARKIYAGCFKTLAFEGKAISDSERNSNSFISDQTFLDDDYTASMMPGTFELAYTASTSNAQKVRMVSFKLFLQINAHEFLALNVHGDSGQELRSLPSTSLPERIDSITAISNPEQGVTGLIFYSTSGETPVQVQVIPAAIFDVKSTDTFDSLTVPESYRLAGVQSIS